MSAAAAEAGAGGAAGAPTVTYHLAGVANDVQLATAERVLHILAATMPSVGVRVHMFLPEEWRAYLAAKTAELGLAEHQRSSPVVWTDTGRVVGGLIDFLTYARDVYGVECDYDQAKVAEVAEANHTAVCAARKSAAASREAQRRALVVVGLQSDLVGDTEAPVPVAHAEDAIIAVNALRKRCRFDAVVLTQAWLPRSHVSFASNSGDAEAKPFSFAADGEGNGKHMLWPEHCIAGELGAALHPYLDRDDGDVVVRYGHSEKHPIHSAFGDASGAAEARSALEAVLRDSGVEHVFVVGAPLEYHVAATALDAKARGFRVSVVPAATKELGSAKQRDAALASLERAGVELVAPDEMAPAAASAHA